MTILCCFLTAGLLLAAISAQAQATPPTASPPSPADAAAQAAAFAGAPATRAHYRAVYQLDSDDPRLIRQTLRNMRNALHDPRLQGKLELELVVFSGGTVVFQKNQPYEADVLALHQAGVILAQCHNSLIAYKLTKADLLPYVAVVPTGNGELIIRQAEGWALIHP